MRLFGRGCAVSSGLRSGKRGIGIGGADDRAPGVSKASPGTYHRRGAMAAQLGEVSGGAEGAEAEGAGKDDMTEDILESMWKDYQAGAEIYKANGTTGEWLEEFYNNLKTTDLETLLRQNNRYLDSIGACPIAHLKGDVQLT